MYPGSEEFEAVEARRDKEVTLGPIMLTVLGAGLVAVCSVCFIAGYELGNHGAALPGLKGAAMKDSGPSAAEILAQAKPAATPATPAPRHVDPPVTITKVSAPVAAPKDSGLPAAAPPSAMHASAVVPAAVSSSSQAPSTGPVVRPALAVTTQPAAAWRVQIAAVEHTDDADVLVSALRKRGYVVSVHHDLTDNLLHVQVGPFSSRSDADAMRLKLLNDGYNAVIQY